MPGCGSNETERSFTSDRESNGLSGTTTPPFRSVPWKRATDSGVFGMTKTSSPAEPARLGFGVELCVCRPPAFEGERRSLRKARGGGGEIHGRW